MNNALNFDIVILCGGQGTRLKEISAGIPKPMMPIEKYPFLLILVQHYLKNGFRRIILAVGYKSLCIEKYFQKSNLSSYIIFSEEKFPLDTAGAVKNASRLIESDNFFVVNGDSFCKYNVSSFMQFHKTHSKALASLVLVPITDRTDCGYITLNRDAQVTSFNEKVRRNKMDYINAGTYLFNRKILSFIPDRERYSLENELFPALVAKKLAYGYVEKTRLIDIGVPVRYREALEYFNNQLYY